MNTKSSIPLQANVTIELVDKKTGAVVDKIDVKNALNSTGAQMLLYYINGQATALYGAWKYCVLFDSAKTRIKELTGTWGTATIYPTYVSATLQTEDTSNDPYTVNYVGLYHQSGETRFTVMLAWVQISPKTKASDQILRVRWEQRCSYTSP